MKYNRQRHGGKLQRSLNEATPGDFVEVFKGCVTKGGFPRKVARSKAKAIAKKTGRPWKAYPCKQCGKWHLSSQHKT